MASNTEKAQFWIDCLQDFEDVVLCIEFENLLLSSLFYDFADPVAQDAQVWDFRKQIHRLEAVESTCLFEQIEFLT